MICTDGNGRTNVVAANNLQAVTSGAVAAELLQKASCINEISGQQKIYKMNEIVPNEKNFALIILQNGSISGSESIGIYTEFGGFRIDWIHDGIPTAHSFDSSNTELTITPYTRVMIMF